LGQKSGLRVSRGGPEKRIPRSVENPGGKVAAVSQPGEPFPRKKNEFTAGRVGGGGGGKGLRGGGGVSGKMPGE